MTEIPLGYCQCGCGERTAIPTRMNTKLGRIKGQPMRYLVGHATRGRKLRKGRDWKLEDRGYTTPCRIWQHQITKAGYGRVSAPDRSHRQEYTHIMEWEAVHGPVPDGLELDHLCQQRDCGNVDHLEAVTHAENVRRGRAGTHRFHASKTHCPNGHPYAGDNLYVSGGRRHCRECRRQAKRRYRERLKT